MENSAVTHQVNMICRDQSEFMVHSRLQETMGFTVLLSVNLHRGQPLICMLVYVG